jgi:hypothetical protein
LVQSPNPTNWPERAPGDDVAVRHAVNVSSAAPPDELLAALDFQLRAQGFIPMFKPLTLACGGPKPALFVAFMTIMTVTMYKRRPERKGWIYLTADELWKLVGLSPDEQKGARKTLLQLGLIEERRTYNPSRLHFRVNQVGLAQALELDREFTGNDTPIDNANPWGLSESPFTRLLDGQALFFAPLARLVDDVGAAIVLGNLIEQLRSALRSRASDWGGFFAASWERLQDELGLSPKQIRRARERLKRIGFVQEQLRGCGTHARVHVKIGLNQILACLQAQDRAPLTARLEARAAARKIAAPQQSAQAAPTTEPHGYKPQPSLDQALASLSTEFSPSTSEQQGSLFLVEKREPSDPLDQVLDTLGSTWCPKPGLLGAQNRVSYTYTYLHNPTTTLEVLSSAESRSSSGVDDQALENIASQINLAALEALVFPSGIDAERLHPIISRAPSSLRQTLLDELHGAMTSKHKTVNAPAAFLHSLVVRASKGDFIPAYAPDVAQAREARAAHAKRLREAVCMQPSTPVDDTAADSGPDEASKARGEAARARLREITAALRRGDAK